MLRRRMLATLHRLDRRLLLAARTCGHSPARDRAVLAFTLLGEHGAGWLALGAAGAALEPARRERWGRAMATIGAAYLANQAVKFTVRRRRPQVDGLDQLAPTGSQLSFPSAHATSSFAAVVVYARLGLPVAPLLALAAGLAASRVWLGVHYPSDVLAGAALGTAIGALAP